MDELSATAALKELVLPRYSDISSDTQAALLAYILQHWSTLQADATFVTALKSVPFVSRVATSGGETVAGVTASGLAYYAPKDLLDPRVQLFSELFPRDAPVFPAGVFAEPQWLGILSDCGMESDLSKDTLILCAKQVRARTQYMLTRLDYMRLYVSSFEQIDTGNLICICA